ncbi:MAG: hypothetical protein ABJB98_05490 [Actinomycetota bacterium]
MTRAGQATLRGRATPGHSVARARAGWTAPTLIAAGPARVRLPLSARRAPFALLVSALLAAGLSALLALNTASAAAELRRHDLAATNADLSGDEQQLNADLAARRAPAALARAAAQLGMVPITNPGYLTLRPNGSVAILGNPQPATRPPAPPAPKAKSRTKAVPTRPRSGAASSRPLPGGPR